MNIDTTEETHGRPSPEAPPPKRVEHPAVERFGKRAAELEAELRAARLEHEKASRARRFAEGHLRNLNLEPASAADAKALIEERRQAAEQRVRAAMQEGMGELAQARDEAPLPPVDARDILLATDPRLSEWWCEEVDRRVATTSGNPFSPKTNKQLASERSGLEKRVTRLKGAEEKAGERVAAAVKALRRHRSY